MILMVKMMLSPGVIFLLKKLLELNPANNYAGHRP